MFGLGAIFNLDVHMKLDTVCEMYRVDIKEAMSNIMDSHQYLGNNIRDVVTEVGSHLTKNNEGNNQQEDVLKALSGSIIGLRGELEENRNNNQKFRKTKENGTKNGRRKKEGE